MKNSDFFRRKDLCKIKAWLLLLHYYELMKLCLKNCPSPPQKKKILQEKKTTRSDLTVITPATPRNRHSSEKQNSFPPAMK